MNYLQYLQPGGEVQYIEGTNLPSTGDAEKDAKLLQAYLLQSKDQPLSGTDPVGQFVVEGVVLGKPFELAGRAIMSGITKLAARLGSTRARAKIISAAIDEVVDKGVKTTSKQASKVVAAEQASQDTGKTSYAFFERPNTLSKAEKAGVPKGERVYSDPEILVNAEEFAKKYGYDIPKTIDEAKQMYKQHNSFFRTIIDPDDVIKAIQESDPKLAKMLKSLSREDQIKMLASKGYPSAFRGYDLSQFPGFSDDFVFVSPSIETNLPYIEAAGNRNTTVLLRRPFSFNNPKTWHIDADWRPLPSDKIIEYPRSKGIVQIGNVSPDLELKISTDHLIPYKLADASDKGSHVGSYLAAGNKKYGGILNYFQYFQDGGQFQSFLSTLPQNLQYTGDYDMQRYWELNGKPANFEEGIKKGMFYKQEDGYHAKSVMWNPERGVYEWMKAKNHPTAWMENLATELSGFQKDWRVQIDPVRENYLMYTRREQCSE